MPLKADITGISHSASDKTQAAAHAVDLDSMKQAALLKIDEAAAAVTEYKNRLPVGHTGIAALASTLSSHI